MLTNPKEFTVDIRWEMVDGATKYIILEVKIDAEWKGDWSDAKRKEVDGGKTQITLDELEPTSTYQFRISAVTANGETPPSEPVTVDTAVANCTPKPKCIVS